MRNRFSNTLRLCVLAPWREACLIVLLAALSGCQSDIERTYGERSGPGASESVNGTAVLAEMFEHAGHRVFSWSMLSPRLKERADCIVWFPNDFEPPKEKVRVWLENWLQEQNGRTLIYVGRDFDAAPGYWKAIQPSAPPGQSAEVARRRNAAQADYITQRGSIAKKADCDWFTVDGAYKPRSIRKLQGTPEWLEGVDPAKVEIALNSRLTPSPSAVPLLRSGRDTLVSRDAYDTSQLVLVANGSFLLNLPLVNHEHRKLAGKLIDQIGPGPQTVVFLESGHGGPHILDHDPSASMPTGMEIFQTWPTNWILLHLAALGIIFCFSRWPIFGLPRPPAAEGLSDFGKHIQALGELLEYTRDRAYALARIEQYRKTREQTRTKEPS